MSPRSPEDKYDVVRLAREAARVQRKSIRVLPDELAVGSREVALLTAVTKAQATTIIPMAEALKSLRDKGPDIWGKAFLVAADGDFDWRTAPLRRYESFEDFYDTELAPVYGCYEDFVRDHAKVLRGELTEDEAAQRAIDRADAVKARTEKLDGKTINSGDGPMTKADRANGYIVTVSDGQKGNNAEYLTRRIVRDHPQIAERMRNGEYKSVRAAALDAGITKPTTTIRTDDPTSIVATLRRQLPPEVLTSVVNLLNKTPETES